MNLWAEVSRRAAQAFGLTLGAEQVDSLSAYAELVLTASSRLNLVSARSLEEIAYRHVLDSLAPIPFLGERREVADIGSGAGFPGIPLAVAVPHARFHLIESRRRRANFLRHAVRTLSLQNVEVVEVRAEEWNGRVEVATARGIRFDELAGLAGRVLARRGELIVMAKARARNFEAEGFDELDHRPYELPGGEQHEVRLYRLR